MFANSAYIACKISWNGFTYHLAHGLHMFDVVHFNQMYQKTSPMGQVAIGFWLVPNEVVSHLALSCFRRRIVFFSRAQPHGTRKKTSPSTFRDSPTGQILIFHDISILNWFVGMSKFPLSKRTILPTILKKQHHPNASVVYQHYWPALFLRGGASTSHPNFSPSQPRPCFNTSGAMKPWNKSWMGLTSPNPWNMAKMP